MAQKYSFGVKSLKVGGIDPVTGLPTGLESVGDVYKDTATWTEADGAVTNHYAEGKADPVVVITEQGEETFAFSLMNFNAQTLQKFLGGTVTSVVDEPDVWNKPLQVVEIEKSVELETEDGSIFTIYRGKIMAKRNVTPTKTGLNLLEVMVRPLAPLVEDLPAVSIQDAE